MSADVEQGGPLLSVREVTISRPGVSIVDSVSADFPEGAASVIMGPSGCGKSALLKIAAGILQPDSGMVLFEGRSMRSMSEARMREFRRRSGFVFQDSALWANMNVYQNLALPLRFHFPAMTEEEIERRIRRLAERLEFAADLASPPAALSSGEQKTISFARAIIGDPSILFMDSPTLSIDSVGARRIAESVRELKREGKTIIAATHDPGLASMIADRLVVLSRGRILAAGPFGEVVNSRDTEVTAILTEVLSRASTFDQSILDLLGND